MGMTLRHFRIFRTVAETGSITKAAEQLYVTQPTVSAAVREMEEHYGVRFFDRVSQRIRITENGKAMLSYAVHLLSVYDEIERAFQTKGDGGVLRVGASIAVGNYVMPALAKRFAAQCPGTQLRVHVSPSEQIERQLLDNQLDMAVSGGTFQSQFMKQQPLFSERYEAVCAPDDPMAGQSVTLGAFMERPLLFREQGSGAYEVFQAAVTQAGRAVEPAWESSSQEALLAAARNGLGVTILPAVLAEEEIAAGRLAHIGITDFFFRNTVCLIWHKGKYLTKTMQQFMALAEAYAAEFVE